MEANQKTPSQASNVSIEHYPHLPTYRGLSLTMPQLAVPQLQENGEKLLIGSHTIPITSLSVVDHTAPRAPSKPSTIHDGGDDKQLGAQGRDRESYDSQSASTQYLEGIDDDDLLSCAGNQFQDTPARPGELQLGNTGKLEAELRNALIMSTWRPHGATDMQTLPKKKLFLPLDKLDKIITKQSVKAEILSWGPRDVEDVERIAHDIWGQHTVRDRDSPIEDGKFSKTTRRKLFAILILTGSAQTILGLIEEKIFDIHLPFTVDPDNQTMKIQWKADGELQEISAFSDWMLRYHDIFDVYQWYMLAPYFVLSSKEAPKVHTYKLQGMRPLPFITDSTFEGHDDPISGGFGEVRRVRIHEAHLAPGSQSVSSSSPNVIHSV